MRKILIAAALLALTACTSTWRTHTNVSEASADFSCDMRLDPLLVQLYVLPTPERELFGALKVSTEYGLFPGSDVYVSIDGKRFAGKEGIPLAEDDLLASLRGGRLAYVSWSPWPWGGRQEQAVSLDGFSEAYDDCAAWMTEMRSSSTF